jgi:hypothetical protein
MPGTSTSGTPAQAPGVSITISTPVPTKPAPTATRPLLVAVLAVIMGAYGLTAIVVGLLAFHHTSLGALTKWIDWVPNLASFSGWVGASVTLLIGLVILITAVGLWRLKMLWLVIALLGVIYEIGIFAYAREFTAPAFIVAVVLLVYLIAVSGHFS